MKGTHSIIYVWSRDNQLSDVFSFACFSETAARALDKAMDRNVSLIGGMSLVRNNSTISRRQARLLGMGLRQKE